MSWTTFCLRVSVRAFLQSSISSFQETIFFSSGLKLYEIQYWDIFALCIYLIPCKSQASFVLQTRLICARTIRCNEILVVVRARFTINIMGLRAMIWYFCYLFFQSQVLALVELFNIIPAFTNAWLCYTGELTQNDTCLWWLMTCYLVKQNCPFPRTLIETDRCRKWTEYGFVFLIRLLLIFRTPEWE